MRHLPHAFCILACLIVSSTISSAAAPPPGSSDPTWQELAVRGSVPSGSSGPHPSTFKAYRVALTPLRIGLGASGPGGAEFTLPLPDGRLARFRAVESSVLGPAMRSAHPELRTYRVIGMDDPLLSGSMESSPLGVRAMVFTPQGTALIDPLGPGRADAVMSYWLRDDPDGGAAFDCTELAASAGPASSARLASGSVGDQLKTVRFILMATGEYTQALGGQAQALAQMATAMNRINAIYERDAALHFDVVQMMAFDDPATDPYPPGPGGPLAGRNQAVVDSIFGPSGYDLSQAISVTAGYTGQAFRPSACSPGFTLHSGVTGPDPAGNQFMAHVMPHEIGHMLGATHTQDRACNRSLTPVEVSSGLTIMSSLGGACPAEIQPFADPFLHVASIEQVDTVLANPLGCLSQAPTGNTPPVVNAGPDFTIPRSTPFVLTGSGSDADPGDAVTFTWEQVDKAATSGDLTFGPLFRWRPPITTPSRLLPALATVLSGVPDPFEKLPTVDRLLHFRLVARDNHPGAGGHAWDEMEVTVSGAPFVVTFPNGGNSFPSGAPFNVTWDVGGGGVAANVNILLSIDGGTSWTPLVTGTLNDGFEPVTYFTGVTRTACRIKVEAAGNIFYDVSDADFTIVGGVTATQVTLLQSESSDDGILVRWRLADPGRYTEVTVERGDAEGGPWIAPAGERNEEPDATTFLDRGVEPGHTYYYRLQVTSGDGETATFGPIAALALETPASLAITGLVPNPTPGTMRIDYAIPRAGRVRLRVLDIQGRTVATLVDEAQPAGRSQVTWTAGRARGTASGLYFVRIDTEAGTAVRRAVITR